MRRPLTVACPVRKTIGSMIPAEGKRAHVDVRVCRDAQDGRSQFSRFGTLNIHASGNATAAASADIMNAFRYPPIAAWR